MTGFSLCVRRFMVFHLFLLSLTGILMCSCATQTGKLATNSEGNQFFTLGSLHGKMIKHPKYTLKEFIGAIELFHPDLILTEVRPEFPGSAEGSIDGGIEQSIIYAIGESKGAKLIPVDWFNDAFIEGVQRENEKADPKMEDQVRPLFKSYENIFLTESFEQIHQKATSDLVRDIYTIYERNGLMLYRERNVQICKNIETAIAGVRGKRVLIIFGLDHKFFIDDFLKTSGRRVLSVEDWYNSSNVNNAPISSSLKTLSVRNLNESKQLLQKRLKEKYYNQAYHDRLGKKLNGFDSWIEAVNAL